MPLSPELILPSNRRCLTNLQQPVGINKSARSIFLVRNSGACLLTQKQGNKNNHSLYEPPFIAGDRQIELERKIDTNNWTSGTLSLL